MIKVNTTEVTDVVFNGIDLTKVYYNGVLVWEKVIRGSDIDLMHFALEEQVTARNVKSMSVERS